MIVNVKRFKFLGQAEGNAVSDFTFQRKSQIVRLKREMGSKSDNNILGITFEILKYFEAGSLICPTHTFLNVYLRLSGNHVLKCLNQITLKISLPGRKRSYLRRTSPVEPTRSP